jgi:hypothetical protein
MAKKSRKISLVPDRKLTLPVFIITAAAAIFLRTYQLINNVDLTTGMYYNREIAVNYPVIAIGAGFAVILLLLFFGKSEDRMSGSATLYNPMNLPISGINKNYGAGSAACALVAAGTILFQIVLSLGLVAEENARINETIEDEYFHVSPLNGLGAGDFVSYFLMIVVIVTLITIGVNMFKGDGITKLNCFFLNSLLLLKVYVIFELFFRTQEETRIINLYSERMYIIFSNMAMVFFMISLIRVFSGMEEKFSRIGLIFWGYASIILYLVSILPRFIVLIITPYDQVTALDMPSVGDVGFIIITFAIIFGFFGKFSYREMAKMTYKEGRRDHWISEIAGAVTEMDSISVESLESDDEKSDKAFKNKETNIDDLY